MIRRTLPFGYHSFARHLLRAMGLTAVAGLPAGCGGKVLVDQPDLGTGGAGSSSVASSSAGPTVTSSSVTGGFTCDVPLSPGSSLEYACVPAQNGCPRSKSPAALEELGNLLDTSMPCPEDPQFCSCGEYVIDVPCGPDPGGAGCCYYAVVAQQKICEGRPFTVHGAARTAPLAERSDWRAELYPDVSRLDSVSRQALADAWARDAGFEHASIAAFARFTLELLVLGAPAELVRDAQRAMADEIRHAELAFGLATAFAGVPRGPGAMAIDEALAGRSDPAAILEATVKEGCIGETLAALVALAARDAATDPVVRAALDEIACDEAAHAALAWRTVAWAMRRAEPNGREAIRRAFADATAPEVPDDPEGVDRAALRAFGCLPAIEARAVVQRGFEAVVKVCATELLEPPRDVIGPMPTPASLE